MFHNKHVLTDGMYLPFCSFLCPPQTLQWVYPAWVHSQCSLEVLLSFFELFRCRNLAFNKFANFSWWQACVLYLGWHPDAPCMFVHPWGSDTPHMSPMLLSASVCSERHLHVVGVVGGPLHVGHLPYMLDTFTNMVDASPYVLSPHTLVGFLVHLYVFWEYLHVIWGILPLCWGFGSSPICWGSGGISIPVKLWCLAVHPLGVHYALSCTFLVAHYLLGTGESYGLTTQHMQDCPIFFIQLNHVHK